MLTVIDQTKEKCDTKGLHQEALIGYSFLTSFLPLNEEPIMTMLQSLGLLLSICAATAYINQRFFKWPQVLALNMMSIIFGLSIVGWG